VSGPLIILTGCIYVCVSIEQYVRGNIAGAITWGAYAVSNIGLWMMAK